MTRFLSVFRWIADNAMVREAIKDFASVAVILALTVASWTLASGHLQMILLEAAQ